MSRDHVADHLLLECARWRGNLPGVAIATAPGFDPGAHFTAQLGTFAAVGLLDPDEAPGWWERFHATAPTPRLEPDDALRERAGLHLDALRDAGNHDALNEALHTLVGIGALTTGEAVDWLGDDEAEDDDWEDVTAPDLLGVVLGPPEEAGGFRVVAVELYPAGLVMRWAAREVPELALADDVGTDYEERDGEADVTGGRRFRGHTAFAPALPPDATLLAVDVPGGRVEIHL